MKSRVVPLVRRLLTLGAKCLTTLVVMLGCTLCPASLSRRRRSLQQCPFNYVLHISRVQCLLPSRLQLLSPVIVLSVRVPAVFPCRKCLITLPPSQLWQDNKLSV